MLLVPPPCSTGITPTLQAHHLKPSPGIDLKRQNTYNHCPLIPLELHICFLISLSLLVLRHSLRRRSVSWSTTRSTTLPTVLVHHNRTTTLHFCPTSELLQFRLQSIRDVLPEFADMAPNLLVRLQAKRYNGNEAKGKPFPALHYFARRVVAVLTT